MTLEEAINLLADEAESPRYTHDLERVEAFKLGIEALKVIKALRVRYGPVPQFDLPGETEEKHET